MKSLTVIQIRLSIIIKYHLQQAQELTSRVNIAQELTSLKNLYDKSQKFDLFSNSENEQNKLGPQNIITQRNE